MVRSTVTIIIPNYNHANYLPQRIDSVLKQTYQQFEILLMDDCSQDDSRLVIADYANRDPRIKILLNEQNSGSTFKQWNKGIALAEGEYIWIAESDDAAAPTFLEKLVTILEDNPAAGLAYCQSWRIDENGQQHGSWAPVMAELDANLWQHDFVLPGSDLVRRFMVNSNIVPNASAVLMRRSALKAVGPAPETMRIAGDWVFWVRYMMTTKVAFVAESLNYFRFHQHNVRSNTEHDGTQLLEIAQAMKFVKAQVQPEPVLYQKTISQMMQRWFRAIIYYKMTRTRHVQFVQAMSEVEPSFKKLAARAFVRFLYHNKFSGMRMLIGDKLLGRAHRTT
ncbi:MAG: glycosyltransferase family 2 protein [Hymenobacter sp.]|nr:MAG: glycosyltransferase family 2 protein [Hymenobacter sp.]